MITKLLPAPEGSGKTDKGGVGGMHAQAFGDSQCHSEGWSAMEPSLCQPLTSNTVAFFSKVFWEGRYTASGHNF